MREKIHKTTPSNGIHNPTEWLALILILVFSVVIRLPFIHVPMTDDEGAYAYTTYFWLQGDTLYDELWMDRPQGIFLLYALIFKCMGHSTEAIRLFSAVYNAGSVLFVYLIVHFLFSRKTGLLAAFIFAFFSTSVYIEGFTANAELFMTLPSLVSIYFLLLAEGRRENLFLFLSGLFSGIALLVKPSGGTTLFLGLSFITYLHFKTTPKPGGKNLLARLLLLGIGFTVAFLPSLIHGMYIGIDKYLEAVLLFRLRKKSLFSVEIWHQLLRFTRSLFFFLRGNSFLLLSALWGLVLLKISGKKREVWFIALWVFCALLGMAMGGKWWYHYYVQVIPPLAILSSYGLSRLLPLLMNKRLSSYVTLAVLCAFLYSDCINSYRFFFAYTPVEASWRLYHRRGYLVAVPISSYLRRHTHSGDRIYVAHGEAEFYYLARRRSALKYLFVSELILIPQAYDRLIETLKDPRRAPKYIVYLKKQWPGVQKTGRLSLEEILRTYYYIETFIAGVPLYRRRL